MNKNQLIGFAVLAVGGLVVLKVIGTVLSNIFGILMLGGAAYLGYKVFLKKG